MKPLSVITWCDPDSPAVSDVLRRSPRTASFGVRIMKYAANS